MTHAPIRILLADDHAIVREGLATLLEQEEDMEVVAHAEDGHSAIELVKSKKPDIVVMDVSMPNLNGVDATRQILAEFSGAKVLCLSAHREKSLVDAMLQAGAMGYLLKTGAAKELVDAVRTVAQGEAYLSPVIAGDVIRHYTHRHSAKGQPGGPFAELTEREREVLQLVAEGHHTKHIATQLGIGPKTVLAHRDRLMKKLGVDSTVGIARYALREGLSEL